MIQVQGCWTSSRAGCRRWGSPIGVGRRSHGTARCKEHGYQGFGPLTCSVGSPLTCSVDDPTPLVEEITGRGPDKLSGPSESQMKGCGAQRFEQLPLPSLIESDTIYSVISSLLLFARSPQKSRESRASDGACRAGESGGARGGPESLEPRRQPRREKWGERFPLAPFRPIVVLPNCTRESCCCVVFAACWRSAVK